MERTKNHSPTDLRIENHKTPLEASTSKQDDFNDLTISDLQPHEIQALI